MRFIDGLIGLALAASLLVGLMVFQPNQSIVHSIELAGVGRLELILPERVWQGSPVVVALKISPGAQRVQAMPLTARLDLPVGRNLLPEKETVWSGSEPVHFTWSQTAMSQGNVSGKLWLWVGHGDEKQPVLSRTVVVEVRQAPGGHIAWTRWAVSIVTIGTILNLLIRLRKPRVNSMLQ